MHFLRVLSTLTGLLPLLSSTTAAPVLNPTAAAPLLRTRRSTNTSVRSLSLPSALEGNPALRTRQITNSLTLSFPYGKIYLSAGNYECLPVYPIEFGGIYPPFSIDAIRSPFDIGNLSSQTVLQHIGDANASGEAGWDTSRANLAAGDRFAIRVGDGQGHLVFLGDIEVRNGSRKAPDGYCNNPNDTWWDKFNDAQRVFVVCLMVFAGLVGLGIMGALICCILDVRLALGRLRPAAAGAGVDIELAHVAQPAPQPEAARPASPLPPPQPAVQGDDLEPLVQGREAQPPRYEDTMAKAG